MVSFSRPIEFYPSFHPFPSFAQQTSAGFYPACTTFRLFSAMFPTVSAWLATEFHRFLVGFPSFFRLISTIVPSFSSAYALSFRCFLSSKSSLPIGLVLSSISFPLVCVCIHWSQDWFPSFLRMSATFLSVRFTCSSNWLNSFFGWHHALLRLQDAFPSKLLLPFRYWLIAIASHRFTTLSLVSFFFAQKIPSIHWYGFARFKSGLALSFDCLKPFFHSDFTLHTTELVLQ